MINLDLQLLPFTFHAGMFQHWWLKPNQR